MQAKSNPTLKDLDFTEFGEKISVGTYTKEGVMKTLERDIQVRMCVYMEHILSCRIGILIGIIPTYIYIYIYVVACTIYS